MSLRDELPPPALPGPTCRLGFYLEHSDRREEWEELLDDTSLQSASIWVVLRNHGFVNGQNVVNRHRNRRCACFRPA